LLDHVNGEIRGRLPDGILYIDTIANAVGLLSGILGYSELSAFSRAFRRWFGVSPQNFRCKLFDSESHEGFE
jgi:AraC-like DNA-binding protein